MKKIALLGILFVVICAPTSSAFTSQEIQRGAFGDDVIELQARLQYIGFYHGQLDGKFGYGTYWALRNLGAVRFAD